MQSSKLNTLNNSNFIKNAGFTLIELVMVMAVIGILLTFATINILNVNQNASINTNVVTIVADLKQQQVKSMIGDTQGNGIQGNYGIYFGQNEYTLFHNTSYSQNDPKNYPVTLNENVIFLNVNVPGSQIVFATASGEIVNYSSAQNTFQIQNTKTNEQKTFRINRYGAITSVN